MSKIRIKHFGPIKEGYIENNGWIDIKKVTVLIGNQGSGKSTVAKLFSTLTWIEKALNKGELEAGKISFYEFEKQCYYQGIVNYFQPTTEIEYIGDAYSILYSKSNEFPIIKKVKTLELSPINKLKSTEYSVPKIMYVPAERNFLTTIRDAYDVTGLPPSLITFGEELSKAQKELNGIKLSLPINGYQYEYNKEINISLLIGKDHEVNLLEASSGLQSAIPLFLVSRYISKSITEAQNLSDENLSINQIIRRNEEITKVALDNAITETEKAVKIRDIQSRYINKRFINIIEEPEQNLFPTSQWEIIKSLLEFNNLTNGNQLIMTTHSPYIINYLTISIFGESLRRKINESNKSDELLKRLENIIPLQSLISSSDVVIYQLDEHDGSIKKLPDYEGVPSDKNYLNLMLKEGNQFFDSLLEIEEEI